MNSFQEDFINNATERSKLDLNVYTIQTIFQQPAEKLVDFEALSKSLSTYNYELYVLEDKNVVYSNVTSIKKNIKRNVLSMELSGEHTQVYSWAFLTIVGKAIEVDNHEYQMIAVNDVNKDAWFKVRENQFHMFLVDFILIGFATILVLIGTSQLVTNSLVKRIMKPVNQLLEASKRIEEGNLKENIEYKGYEEFETVCSSFNQMQHHLLEEQEQLELYEKARTDMVSGISHDLRTPLTSVKGYIKGLKDGVATTAEKQSQYLDIAYQKACEMDVLLQRLFYFSKMETGNMPFYKQQFDMKDFVNDFVEGNKESLLLKEVQITFSHDINSCIVSIDVEQMLRVFQNLVENSVKYATVPKLEINIHLSHENGQAILVLSDNGIGVEEDKLPRLFEQFYRGDESRSSKNREGNGLGLYIAKYIIEAHDGTIVAVNDNGFKVIITLPEERSV
jgi:signal transduction histidine kinase